ncbi:molybdenum cofactor cytidylyltransferase [Aeromonas veronii]|uniref:molybdenum cofactor cytidylyltransferase n=1 Tax=Aeromonas veronii TaxID=654 RepID=UPI00223C8165|nr:molybdenum cofactor cytidylyltransferase [Aeromonas veronii]MCF5768552.1 molybdenum cofactor cytidylyltransferase [Aeromonas veronii]
MTTKINIKGSGKQRCQEQVQCDCIITAAGLSSRMGTWKMMLPYCQGTMLDASLKNALAFCQRVILVVGHRGEELQARYGSRPDIVVVHNPDYRQGLGSSIRCALAASDADYLFISHGDLPCIPRDVYQQLWQARGEFALFPSYEGEAGHPVLLPKSLVRELAAAPTQGSVRHWLLQRPHRSIPVVSPAILFDIDTPERYQALIRGELELHSADELTTEQG